VYELGREFGIHRTTVGIILKRQGVRMRMQGLSEEHRNEMIALRGQGWSFTRLGERFGVNASTVRNFLVRVTPKG